MRSFGGKGSQMLTDSLTELINDKVDCRTAWATPGLLANNQEFILGGLINHYFNLGQELWSLKNWHIFLEINGKWMTIQGVNK